MHIALHLSFRKIILSIEYLDIYPLPSLSNEHEYTQTYQLKLGLRRPESVFSRMGLPNWVEVTFVELTIFGDCATYKTLIRRLSLYLPPSYWPARPWPNICTCPCPISTWPLIWPICIWGCIWLIWTWPCPIWTWPCIWPICIFPICMYPDCADGRPEYPVKCVSELTRLTPAPSIKACPCWKGFV